MQLCSTPLGACDGGKAGGIYVFQSFESLLSMTHPIEKNKIVWFVLGGVWWNPFVFGVNLEGLGMVSRLMDFANIPSNPASQNDHRWGSWKMLNHQRGSDVWLGFARLCCFFLLLCFFLFFFVCWCSSCSCDDFVVWSRVFSGYLRLAKRKAR